MLCKIFGFPLDFHPKPGFFVLQRVARFEGMLLIWAFMRELVNAASLGSKTAHQMAGKRKICTAFDVFLLSSILPMRLLWLLGGAACLGSWETPCIVVFGRRSAPWLLGHVARGGFG